ncbi:MAG: archaemetzincin family Zn-dependent metalloprotease [Polyangiaceae bacterium]
MKELSLVHFDLPESRELVPWLGSQLERAFSMRVSMTEAGCDPHECFVETRRQYDARRVLLNLAERATTDYILGVTGSDLFMPVFTFVLGEAMLGGSAAVISTFRLDDQRYGLAKNPELLAARVLKEAVHELGHCQGLVHCHDSKCVMYAAGGVEEVDLKRAELCLACRSKLPK